MVIRREWEISSRLAFVFASLLPFIARCRWGAQAQVFRSAWGRLRKEQREKKKTREGQTDRRYCWAEMPSSRTRDKPTDMDANTSKVMGTSLIIKSDGDFTIHISSLSGTLGSGFTDPGQVCRYFLHSQSRNDLGKKWLIPRFFKCVLASQ